MNALKRYNDFWDKVYDDLFDIAIWGDERRVTPKADIIEKDNHYEIFVEVPGYTDKELKVELHNGVLTVKGEKKDEKEEKDEKKKYLRKERYYSSFERRFILPENSKQETMEAKLENGVLKLTVDKKDEEKPKLIQIK